MHLVEAAGVTKRYRRGNEFTEAIDRVDLGVAPGEVVAVMGPSGSGKTTLLNLLGGLETPDDGSVLFDGQALSSLRERQRTEIRRKRIGFVFQRFHLLPELTAAENVALPLLIAATPRGERASRTRELLDAVGLSAAADQPASELSGGEQQRIGVARALAHRPALVLADEPTGNLDSTTGLSIMQLLLAARDGEGVAVVVVTHDARMAALADRIVRLLDGRIDATHDLAPSRNQRPSASSAPS